MPYLLQDATLVTLDPLTVHRADLRIEGSRIVARGEHLNVGAVDEVIDCSEKLVMPGMVCAHTHLYSALARGMPAPLRTPRSFIEILELVWWRLDRALDEETIYWSALAGALDAARAGTTCLFDHHASPSHIRNSLHIVREALEKVGLRAVLCYEVTDRGTADQRVQGLEENRDFLEWTADHPEGHFRGIVGAHASFTLSNEALRDCAQLSRDYDAGLHIHVAEDRYDVDDSRLKYGLGLMERLAVYDVLNGRTILAHATHLDPDEIQTGRSAGVWFVHNPRSNMNNQVGYAPVSTFGERLVLGTDGIGADMFDEVRFAFFKGRDARLGFGAGEWLKVLGANQRLCHQMFGIKAEALSPGAPADLIIVDYQSPTPVTADNLAWHFVFGLNSTAVDSVMVNGKFLIVAKLAVIDVRNLYEKARAASQKLWSRLQEI